MISMTEKPIEHTTWEDNKMATKEFILKRISGTQEKIEKINAKLARIDVALAPGGKNPYFYTESDKKWALRDLEEAMKSLAKYQAQLEQANEKEASRNVPAITEFLNAWKARMTEFHTKRFAEYPAAYKQYQEDLDPFKMDYYQERKFRKEDPKGWKEWDNQRSEIKAVFEMRFAFLNPYLERAYNPETNCYDSWKLDTEKLDKDLKAEWERKYDFIIERTNEIVGKITDASSLKIGNKGDLNGLIYGTKGTAKVQTIGAGGYNIQCFHFRTLITEVTAPKAPAKKPEKPQKTTNNQEGKSYKGKTIDELKAILASLGGECKTYSDEKIYKMRLIMAIKKVG